MRLHPFQNRVCDLLFRGQSVILQAPTGAGKTWAALYPFLRAWENQAEFPRKCIYSVPLRVLADQFAEEYAAGAAGFGFSRPMDVTIQTGARPDDPKLEGNLIFTTVDQTLSNFLNIPYALSTSQANVNAGAVLSAYLVFDELHLFDPGTMLPTVLHLLQMVSGVVPFLAMTATLSGEMIQTLAEILHATPVVLSAEEARALPSQEKTRRIHMMEDQLAAAAVKAEHLSRSIAICNTVGRAQALFDELRRAVDGGTEVRLLHSRFLREHREATEAWLQREFGADPARRRVESAILVATQVVEVGLDITSEALHTELAPAASVIQRAGRCARYRQEAGDVYVYELPLNKQGRRNFAPYLQEQETICVRTRSALADRSGEVLDFRGELAVVDQAHREADSQWLDALSAGRHYRLGRIADAIGSQDRGVARDLIRAVDTRTVIVHPHPEGIGSPWAYEGFGIHRGTLFGAYEAVEELADEIGTDWTMMTAEPRQEDESSRAPTIWEWWDIASQEDLEGALVVAINPRLCHYSPDTGFRLGILPPSPCPGEGRDGALWQSPRRERTKDPESIRRYRRETFQEHVERALRAYDGPSRGHAEGPQRPSLREELDYAARRLEERYKWPVGTLDRLARLVIALHDLGKLGRRWQGWAHRWQAGVSELRQERLALPDGYLAAHTDYDGQSLQEEALNNRLRRAKPNHAVEGARAAEDVLWAHTGEEVLLRASLTAIARHHSAGARGSYGAFEAHPAAREALANVLCGDDAERAVWSFPNGTLARSLVRADRPSELFVYLLLVRALRLADQRSQEARW